ncbi:MAG: conjugal transfer protein TraC [Candidatus Portnoybacteria bacterium RIFCSPHIGHO2_01_FULL_39_19]|nr:MAG: conjugal transfer protein TraC [Candidatus Portnoybacteria bacterium RIFCSPHIGHO2_01_FULL_39_19]
MALFFKKKQPITKDEIISIEEAPEETSLADAVAPSALQITSNYIQIGDKFARTFFVITYPRFLTVNWMSPIINLDRVFNVSMFVHPADTGIILRNLRKKLTQVESQIATEEEQGKVRNPILETARTDIETLRDKLIQGTEKFFKYSLYITIFEDSVEKLNEAEEQIDSLFSAKMVYIKPALFQQDLGINSTFPLGNNYLFITNSMNTGPLSTIFPFTSSNLSSDKGILYGINRHNNSLIIFDRFSMENGNTVIFGKSGSGKSYGVKVEILRSLMFGTDIIVIDPENEYQYLAETTDGAFFKISLNSKHHINPFDISPPGPDETSEEMIRSKIMDLVGLLRVALGELTPEENSILDRALTEVYATKDITPQSDLKNVTPPLLEDLQTVIENMEGGKRIAERLERYTSGSFGGFLNQPTNLDINKNLVVFSIRDMEDELRPVAMFLILQFIWNLIRSQLKKRLMIVDEAWWMMKHESGASFLHGIAKRCRKYWLGLTTITQDVADFMSSPYGKPIITNSSIQMLFRQSPATIDIVKETFNLTDEEKYLLLQADVGEGIFFAGLKHAAIKVVASYTEDQIVTSSPEQIIQIQKAKEELAQQTIQE